LRNAGTRRLGTTRIEAAQPRALGAIVVPRNFELALSTVNVS
jgi:hypothetical protein